MMRPPAAVLFDLYDTLVHASADNAFYRAVPAALRVRPDRWLFRPMARRAVGTGRASYRGPGRRRATPAVSNRALGRDASREPGRLAPWAGRAVAVLVLLGLLVEGTPANGESGYITNR